MKLCSIPECGKEYYAKSLCHAHYSRLRRNGDPLAGATAPGALMHFAHEVAAKYQGNDCLAWPFQRDHEGYGRFRKSKKRWYAHRYICQIVHGEPPAPKLEAAHSCGNGHLGCVNPRHLSWKTRAENAADMVAHGRATRGERNPRAKLTEEQVSQILALKDVRRTRELADQFGVGCTAIDNIIKRRRWHWVEAMLPEHAEDRSEQ